MSAAGQTDSTSAIANFTAAEQAGQVGNADEAYNQLGTSDFLNLLIEELQNQDPLNPMENSEMMQQIGLIREIGATDELTNTLSDFSNSQQLVTASNLIGQSVRGLSDEGANVTGVVDRVTVETNPETNVRRVRVHVDGQTLDVNNIRQIDAAETSGSDSSE
ncbi:MAG: flagellar hook capping FlgD N-terminal domain-containing protein [Planctomycetota bacterium]